MLKMSKLVKEELSYLDTIKIYDVKVDIFDDNDTNEGVIKIDGKIAMTYKSNADGAFDIKILDQEKIGKALVNSLTYIRASHSGDNK